MAGYTSSQSIWEKESYYAQADVIIVGAGLSGLWAALHLKQSAPSLSITIIERGLIPSGASTRNAGFACFGSFTELLHDIQIMGEEKMLQLVALRYQGLQQIMKTFNPADIDFSLCGGYELLLDQGHAIPETQSSGIALINRLVAEATGTKTTFQFADNKIEKFGFSNVRHLIENKMEGCLHPGKLCQQLARRVQSLGVNILYGVNVEGYTKIDGRVLVHTSGNYSLKTTSLLLCTNAFTGSLVKDIELSPARGQVLLTNEIAGLKLNGAFHADEGYYYFRNVGNRVLLGGARNKDFAGETSTNMCTTTSIQEVLEQFLASYILPDIPFSITDRWSGIMAMGTQKLPIVKEIEPHVFCSVRMSGMGVALTPVTGQIIANLILGKDI